MNSPLVKSVSASLVVLFFGFEKISGEGEDARLLDVTHFLVYTRARTAKLATVQMQEYVLSILVTSYLDELRATSLVH
jgi:hypothetical protein